MRNRKHVGGKFLIRLSLIAMLFFGLFLGFASSTAMADRHGDRDHGYFHESGVFSRGYKKGGDHGDETTGKFAAWLLVAANIGVAFSLLSKSLVKAAPLGPAVKDRITRFNRFQKKYLMPFHYYLNLISLVIAFLHFGLSRCRASALPEWGLVSMTLLALIGLAVKFKFSPKSTRKPFHRIHTHPLSLGVVLMLLIAGHVLVD